MVRVLYAEPLVETTWSDFNLGRDSATVIIDSFGGEIQLAGINNTKAEFTAMDFAWSGHNIPLYLDQSSGDSIALIFGASSSAPNGNGHYVRWYNSAGSPISQSIFLQGAFFGRACVDGQGRILLPSVNDTSVTVKRYSPNGSLIDVTAINTIGNHPRWPNVSCNNEGSFVVTWVDNYLDGLHDDIFCRAFNSQGEPNGVDFKVNNSLVTTTWESLPTSAVAENGDFIVVWSEWRATLEEQTSVWAQKFNLNSEELGSNFRINETFEDGATGARLAMSISGTWAVTWEQYRGIWAQYFDSEWLRVGSNRNIVEPFNEMTRYEEPEIAFDNSGNSLITWMDDRDHPEGPPDMAEWWPWDVYGQFINLDFEPVGNNQQLSHSELETLATVKIAGGMNNTFLMFRADQELTWGDQHYGDEILIGSGWRYEENENGEFCSAIHDFLSPVAPTTIWWDAEVPANSTLNVWLRSSEFSFDSVAAFPNWILIENGQSENIPFGQFYQYKLELFSDGVGGSPVFKSITIGDSTLSIGSQKYAEPPNTLSLLSAFPNPFNPSVTIRFEMSAQSLVTLTVYDINGRLVRVLFSDVNTARLGEVAWNGKNDQGIQVSSGTYFVHLQTGSQSEIVKLVYIQ